MHKYRIVKTSVANIYNSSTFTSQIVTQALLWEELLVCEKKDDWYKVKQNDGYVGWIHSFYTIDSTVYDNNKLLKDKNNWFWIKDRFLVVTLKNNSDLYISFGSLIPCIQDEKKFFILLPTNEKINIDTNSLIPYYNRNKIENILSYAKSLIGVPYLWGGKSSFGYDCSGLIQILCKMSGYTFLRDCNMQIKSNLLVEINKEDIKVGDLIYFKDEGKISHVGILLANNKFLHSSGYVKINSINSNDDDFNSKLCQSIYAFYRLKSIQC